ncbi:unnamed protein product, partial [Mesorhabditis belari]|uniref:HAT C-terminal dimerisation domain-containing protein n=1 Tax=Mesorhabditis belari TaxID=2138241 RepID=A0AAF3FED6_9BILA
MDFELLYRIAQELLTAPATSVSSERVFSIAGVYLNNPRRQRISEDTAIKLLNISCNQDHVRRNTWPSSKEARYGWRTAYSRYADLSQNECAEDEGENEWFAIDSEDNSG